MNAVDQAFETLSSRAHGRVERDIPIGPMTSYGLGGPAAVFCEAAAQADLEALSLARSSSGLPILMLGRGSNMLVSDRGFAGIAVRLGAGFRWTRVLTNRDETGSDFGPVPRCRCPRSRCSPGSTRWPASSSRSRSPPRWAARCA